MEYECLKGSINVCNDCSTFEDNEDVQGWRMGKAVGYCEECYLTKSDDESIQSNTCVNQSMNNTGSKSTKGSKDKGRILQIFIKKQVEMF